MASSPRTIRKYSNVRHFTTCALASLRGKQNGSEGKTPMWTKIISLAIIVTFLTGIAAVTYAQNATTEGKSTTL